MTKNKIIHRNLTEQKAHFTKQLTFLGFVLETKSYYKALDKPELIILTSQASNQSSTCLYLQVLGLKACSTTTQFNVTFRITLLEFPHSVKQHQLRNYSSPNYTHIKMQIFFTHFNQSKPNKEKLLGNITFRCTTFLYTEFI